MGPSAKSFPPGKALDDKQKIVLRANDQIVILDGRGTRTLKGPGSFDPTRSSAATSDSRSTFAALVSQRTERRARIGAVRSTGVAVVPRSPNIWYVDVERDGSVCVADPAAVTLWRPDMSGAATLRISDTASGRSATIEWLKGQSARSWPETLPVATGAEFRLEWAGVAQATKLRFAVLGPTQEGLENTAATLIRNGCNAQLDLLVETVAIPDSSTPPTG